MLNTTTSASRGALYAERMYELWRESTPPKHPARSQAISPRIHSHWPGLSSPARPPVLECIRHDFDTWCQVNRDWSKNPAPRRVINCPADTPSWGKRAHCSDSTHTSSRRGDRAFKGPHDPIFDGCREPKKNKRHIAISGMLALGVHGVRFKRDLVTSLVSQKKCED